MMNDIIIARLALQSSNPKTGWLDRQKFAELIVRECADVACKHMELNEGTDYNLGGKIKKHFGVEE